MAVITMCKNNKCTVKYNCERFTAKHNEHRQSYGSFGNETNTMCDKFVNNEKYNLGA